MPLTQPTGWDGWRDVIPICWSSGRSGFDQRLDHKSRMRREPPVRIREGLGVKLPRATRLVITGTSKGLLRDQVRPLVAHFLKERGLELSHEKTRITHVEAGFDFLGQNVRRYDNGKVLIKPSSASVKTFLSK